MSDYLALNGKIKLSELKYDINSYRTFLSNQGGVFQYFTCRGMRDYETGTDVPKARIKCGSSQFAARIFDEIEFSVFSGYDKDGERRLFEHPNGILNILGNSLNKLVKIDDDEDYCLILLVEIDREAVPKLPAIGTSCELFDQNNQSVSPIFSGLITSKWPERATCLLAFSSEQTRIVQFAEENLKSSKSKRAASKKK